MKLPKSQLKLRKNEIKVRKIFFDPRWRITVFHGGIFDFLGEEELEVRG